VSTVGSVVVTNLTTGKRIGSLDKAEVFHFFFVRNYKIRQTYGHGHLIY
jgi:hypothetical protein